MSTDYVDRTATLIRAVEAQELLPHAIRLLSEGGRWSRSSSGSRA
jgi:hypothetical protein